MRRSVLVEEARRHARLKRGGDRQRIELSELVLGTSSPPDELLRIDEALEQLAEQDPKAAELVRLRFFAGLSVEEAAEAVGNSRSSGYQQWSFARAWLKKQVRD